MILVKNMGFLWFAGGFLALAVLVVPFIVFPPKMQKQLSISIGIYYIIILLATIAGNFPVPIMGYGISAFVGYFISANWYAINKKE